jgi:hypothetical protein
VDYITCIQGKGTNGQVVYSYSILADSNSNLPTESPSPTTTPLPTASPPTTPVPTTNPTTKPSHNQNAAPTPTPANNINLTPAIPELTPSILVTVLVVTTVLSLIFRRKQKKFSDEIMDRFND